MEKDVSEEYVTGEKQITSSQYKRAFGICSQNHSILSNTLVYYKRPLFDCVA